jgi:hypothetical protein
MTDSIPEQLILFTRYPKAGQTKTRLIPALGAQGAADFQRRMTERLVEEGRKLGNSRPLNFAVRYEGGDLTLMRRWLGDTLPCLPQHGEDLGGRLRQAFADSFEAGHQRVIIIGADCPALSAAVMEQAFGELAQADVVLGPARDGGYYLVGLRAPLPALFSRIDWGTGKVLSQTRRNAALLRASVTMLEELADVDRPEDLQYLSKSQKAGNGRAA